MLCQTVAPRRAPTDPPTQAARRSRGERVVGVVLRDLRKQWGDFVAVEDLNLEVEDGEFVVLLGPSGCGKTTTMRMVAGLEPVTAGDVFIDGERVNNRLARDRDIAMVFQNYGLYPHMTVGENIGYPLRLRGLRGEERRRRVAEAAAKVHLDALLDRRPRALSGGQRQRVALARAIVRTPQLFMMDEPLSNLDAKLRVSMRAELKHLHHELGTTTIYVTHDQIEAMTLATRVAVMDSGRIVQVGVPETIYGDPDTLFVAAFIGSPPMNFVEGTAADGVMAVGPHRIAVPRGVDGAVVLGVRPDDVHLVAPDEGDVSGTVYSAEYTGNAFLVTVETGDTRVTALDHSGRRATFDETVGLRLDPARRFWFDRDSGRRLRS